MRNVIFETFEKTDVKFLMLYANIGGGLGGTKVAVDERNLVGSFRDVYRNIRGSWVRDCIESAVLPSHLTLMVMLMISLEIELLRRLLMVRSDLASDDLETVCTLLV